MKNPINKTLIILAVMAFAISCTSNNENKTVTKKDITYSDTNTTLRWTAYKTTDKLGVKGTFKSIIVENNSKASAIENIINSTKFKIPTESVYSGNAPRDILIKDFFFGAMMNTDTIYGNFSAAKDGKGIVKIKMNEVEYKNNFTYTFVNDSLKIHTTILLDNWNGKKALSSLHEKCFDKHTGPDGISKTWSDVDVEIISVFK